jgi:hypothetical protein
MHKLSDQIERKFTEVYDASEWQIYTDSGWQDLIDVKQTVKYTVWELELCNGYHLGCADDHIVFLEDYTEIFAKDLKPGDCILTDQGPVAVKQITITEREEHMYDVGIDHSDHRFYSNGILSHNTTCAAIYLIWYAMFHPDQTILIAAHKYTGAQEIMQRIRYVYELCPDHIRAGVINYNKGSIEFENGSRIISSTTTGNTGRGLSISLLYLDEFAHVAPNIAEEFWTSISPTLATGGRAIITSTPNSDEDTFATIWKQAEQKFDEYGNEQAVGINGFHAYYSHWSDHPERDNAWMQTEMGRIGEERFRREYACVSASTCITLQDQNANVFDITMGQLFEQYQTDHSAQTFKSNIHNYKVLTDNGFQDFAGISMQGVKPLMHLQFDQAVHLECTYDHKIYVNSCQYQTAQQLESGKHVLSSSGMLQVIGQTALNRSEPVYDLIEVSGGHRYYTNTVLSSNCEFLVYDETLINSIKLAEMQGEQPVINMGQTRWYKKPSAQYSYVVALDPSMGTGGDYAAIQVIELPTYVQVAEWQHNTTAIPGQIRVLRDVCQYISETTGSSGSNIYWSVENNGIGEAALIVIADFGEENIPGLFVSEPMRKGHVRKFRKGFNTTHGTKITACSRLKTMIENNKLIINSKALVSELKNYVAIGAGYQAKQGATDDLVSSMLLALRIISVMKEWDPTVYDTFVQMEAEDDYELPMPIYISTNY